MKTISIIIPTLNEEDNLPVLLQYLKRIPNEPMREIIVVDGHSTDNTCEVACRADVRVLCCEQQGRAAQMNLGAAAASGDILQFIHADTRPPESNFSDVLQAVDQGYPIGCFTYRFDSRHPLLRINGWFTHLDRLWCRGGDQAIFITRAFFDHLGGYNQHWKIMEEYDLIIRARKEAPFKIIRKDGLVSARKYKDRSYLKVQIANLIVFNMFRRGYSQEKLVRTYHKLLG